MKVKKIPLVLKILIIQILFLLLHYLYDWFPCWLTSLCSGINESIYQHMKIGFFSYIFFAIIEFLIIRKSITDTDRFVFSRMFSTIFFPLIMIVIYLINPMLFGHIENIALEVIFANFALIATSYVTLIVEKQLEANKPSLAFKIVVIILFLLSLAQFIVFTKEVPWYDIFALPPGY